MRTMSKLPDPPPEEIVAQALNEQGYLFQHRIATALLTHEKNSRVNLSDNTLDKIQS